MSEKKFNLSVKKIEQIIRPIGSCYVSDKITVEGLIVGFMYREDPRNKIDSGWRFFSGTEDQEYVDNPNNIMLFDVNTIANHDPAIIPYLDSVVGSEFLRNEDNTFRQVDSTSN